MLGNYGNTLFSHIETPTGIVLYPYQCEQIERIINELEVKGVQATLDVSPTGTGKSFVMSQLGHEYTNKGKVLFIVDQINLSSQLASEIHAVTGYWPSTERGQHRISEKEYEKAKMVISTVQTLNSGKESKRYMKLNPFDFSMVIIDEAHCFANKTGIETANWFKSSQDCKVVGFTATADRADGVSLSCLFDSVAYNGQIKDFVNNGWLVKPQVEMVHLENYDISNVGLSGGDLNAKQLEKSMINENLPAAMAKEIVKKSKDMKTLVFCPGVTFAELIRDHLNGIKPGSAGCIFGHTNKDERSMVDSEFKKGDLQYFVNVGVAIKGYNFRGIEMIADCAPTKSRNRQVQKTGRGLRTLAGVLDGLEDASPEVRLQAIADSNKPVVYILDFYGNLGKHKLVSAVDVLAGDDYSDEAIKLAKEKIKANSELDIQETLEESEKEVKRNRNQRVSELVDKIRSGELEVTTTAKYELIDAFALFDIPRADYIGHAVSGRLATKEQIKYLKKYNISSDGLTFEQAKIACDECAKIANIPTKKQVDMMYKMGIPAEFINSMNRKRAGYMMSLWTGSGFKPYRFWKDKAGLEK